MHLAFRFFVLNFSNFFFQFFLNNDIYKFLALSDKTNNNKLLMRNHILSFNFFEIKSPSARMNSSCVTNYFKKMLYLCWFGLKNPTFLKNLNISFGFMHNNKSSKISLIYFLFQNLWLFVEFFFLHFFIFFIKQYISIYLYVISTNRK